MPSLMPDDRIAERALTFAVFAASLSLFIMPFRATAGFRAGLLILAFIAILVVCIRERDYRRLLLPAPLLLWAVGWWAATVGAFAAFGPAPQESLQSWRGDVLIPILACWVFYLLTKTPRDLERFIAVLFAGLFILATMVALDPFEPENPGHTSLYGTVGLASTWFITLAPLLPFAWLAGADRRAMWGTTWRMLWRIATVLAVVALVVGAWFTGNRLIWICYGVMLAVGIAFMWIGEASTRVRTRTLLAALAGLLVLGAGFYGASVYRANVDVAHSDAAIEFMRKDNRNRIWQEAYAMIREKPLTGHGYALHEVDDAFAARFNEPWFRTYIHHAHNIVLNYAVQMGVFAAAVLVVLFLALWWTFMRIAKRVGAQAAQAAYLAGVCGLMLVTGVFLRNMMDDFFMRHSVLLFAAMIGMFLGLGLSKRQNY